MNSTYSINETARKRIESVRRKYRQGSLSLDNYLEAVQRTIILRNHHFSTQNVTDADAQISLMAKAVTK